MNLYVIAILISLIILIILIIVIRKQTNKFTFRNLRNSQKIPKYIWMYWEDKNETISRPAYLDLCEDTIRKNIGKEFKVHMLNEKTVYKYLPELDKEKREKLDELRIPQKADYFRLALLKKYGGMWLDADIIVFSDLNRYFEHLKKFDFVGFGCHSQKCLLNPRGYPRPANWALISRKNGILVTECLKECDKILHGHNIDFHRPKNYHIFGRELLWKCISSLLDTTDWDYYHVSSTCLDRDSYNNKITNKRAMSNESLESSCDYTFIPVYNTAPGFPEWFLKLSKKEILGMENVFMSKMFRKALTN